MVTRLVDDVIIIIMVDYVDNFKIITYRTYIFCSNLPSDILGQLFWRDHY